MLQFTIKIVIVKSMYRKLRDFFVDIIELQRQFKFKSTGSICDDTVSANTVL